MLEKYICTPEEAERWKKENQRIMKIYERTPERKDKKDFTSSLNRGQMRMQPIIPYLSKKKFNEEFAKRKEEQAIKKKQKGEQTVNNQSKNNQPDEEDDGLPF